MGLSLGGIAKIAIPSLASMIPGIGPVAGPLAAGVLGGMGTKKAGKNALADLLRASRVDQTNAYGDTSKWMQGPNGQWTQTQTFSPERQAQFDSFNRMAGNRMNAASGVDLSRYAKGIDWDKLGFGNLSAATGGTGTTGQRPWAQSPYTSMGGDYLRYLQFAQPSANNPISGQYNSSISPMPMRPGG